MQCLRSTTWLLRGPVHPPQTRYLSQRTVGDPRPLKRARYNHKIGNRVKRGPLKGALVFCLTLEERATCSVTCGQWEVCYGNHMPWAKRHQVSEELLLTINAQLDDLCSKHQKILVRLHVLGDFASPEYVEFWQAQLIAHPNLWAYGYTHWPPESRVGTAIQRLLNSNPKCRILQSEDEVKDGRSEAATSGSLSQVL
jgi:hypothetical protein